MHCEQEWRSGRRGEATGHEEAHEVHGPGPDGLQADAGVARGMHGGGRKGEAQAGALGEGRQVPERKLSPSEEGAMHARGKPPTLAVIVDRGLQPMLCIRPACLVRPAPELRPGTSVVPFCLPASQVMFTWNLAVPP